MYGRSSGPAGCPTTRPALTTRTKEKLRADGYARPYTGRASIETRRHELLARAVARRLPAEPQHDPRRRPLRLRRPVRPLPRPHAAPLRRLRLARRPGGRTARVRP